MNLTILTCCYNTPKEVINLLKSVKETSEDIPKLVLMNTSTISECELVFQYTKIPYFNYRGAIHGEGVNLGLKKVTTRYVLLVDSDIIFLKDYKKAFEKFKETGCALMGKVVGDCAGKSLYPRVEPWYCFIDLDQLKRHKIEFFDRERTKLSKKSERVYDIGSTMFEDCQKHGLLIGDVDMSGKYFHHYGGMSWHCNNYNPDKPDTDVDFGGTHPNKALYEHGVRVRQQYDTDVIKYKDVDIEGVFYEG
jgi:glycosyltransferase involved in cell wall biosynthesis